MAAPQFLLLLSSLVREIDTAPSAIDVMMSSSAGNGAAAAYYTLDDKQRWPHDSSTQPLGIINAAVTTAHHTSTLPSSSSSSSSFSTRSASAPLRSRPSGSTAARRSQLLLLIRAAFAELLATMFLVFLPCSAALVAKYRAVDRGSAAMMTGLTAGLTVSFCVFAFYPVSGCQMNPAITLSLLLTKHVSPRRFLVYATAQLIGAMLACGLLFLCFQLDSSVWIDVALKPATIATLEEQRADGDGLSALSGVSSLVSVLCMEACGTFIACFVNFMAAVDREKEEEGAALERIVLREHEHEDEQQQQQEESEDSAAEDRNRERHERRTDRNAASRLTVVPIAVAMGCTVAVLVSVGQASSQGAFNPARYVASAVWSGHWDGWQYWIVGETIGALLATAVRVGFDTLASHAAHASRRARRKRSRQYKLSKRQRQLR